MNEDEPMKKELICMKTSNDNAAKQEQGDDDIRLCTKVRRYELELVAARNGLIREFRWKHGNPKKPTRTFVNEYIKARNRLLEVLASMTGTDHLIETTVQGKQIALHIITDGKGRRDA